MPLDSHAILRRLNELHKSGRSVLELAYEEGLYDPHRDDSGNHGRIGEYIQDLVHPAYSGRNPDYLHSELKCYDFYSKSAITLGAIDFGDINRTFENSTLFKKIFNTVFCCWHQNGMVKIDGVFRPNILIVKFFNSNLYDSKELFDLMEHDYSSLLKFLDTKNSSKNLTPTVVDLFENLFEDKENLTTRTKQKNVLSIDNRSDGRKQWRLSRKFLKIIENQFQFHLQKNYSGQIQFRK